MLIKKWFKFSNFFNKSSFGSKLFYEKYKEKHIINILKNLENNSNKFKKDDKSGIERYSNYFKKEIIINFKLFLNKLNNNYNSNDLNDAYVWLKEIKKLNLEKNDENMLLEYKNIIFKKLDKITFLKDINIIIKSSTILNLNKDELNKLYIRFIYICKNNEVIEFSYLFCNSIEYFFKNKDYLKDLLINYDEIILNNLDKFGPENIFHLLRITKHEIFLNINLLEKLLEKLLNFNLFLDINDNYVIIKLLINALKNNTYELNNDIINKIIDFIYTIEKTSKLLNKFDQEKISFYNDTKKSLLEILIEKNIKNNKNINIDKLKIIFIT